MTYCWLLPPLCDPLGKLYTNKNVINIKNFIKQILISKFICEKTWLDGHLLVDGCYVNNVPGKDSRTTYNSYQN